MSTHASSLGSTTLADKKGTWELNSEQEWHVGPSLLHYRCVKCYFLRTRDVRDRDTIEFFYHAIPFPRVILNNYLKQAATNVISILSNPLLTQIKKLGLCLQTSRITS